MSSLQSKLLLTLMGTCIGLVLLIATITPWVVEQSFIEGAKEKHYQHFARGIEGYIQRYHSWGTKEDAARYSEITISGPPRPVIGRPVAPGMSLRPEENLPEPTFLFALVDPTGVVLDGGKRFRVGQVLPKSDYEYGDPIKIGQRIVAYALPTGRPTPTPEYKMFSQSLREALMLSTLVAACLIIPIALWRSNSLVRPLRGLITAVNRMADGDLVQKVEVNSKDEIGQLAKSFNLMNDRLVEADQHLRELSLRDELTGLYNRRYFNQEIAGLCKYVKRQDQPMTIVLGDIDHFKKINDNFSHIVGDQVLVKVAELLRQSMRGSDIVARFGGEEMVIALPATSTEQAKHMIERLRKQIEAYDWHSIRDGLAVTMSFGLCQQKPVRDWEAMLAQADEELYRAKNNGRNQVCVAEQLALC